MTDINPQPLDAQLACGVTRQIAALAASLRYEDLSAEALEVVKQCVLDTLGVAIAGASDPVVEHVRALCLAEGANPAASLIMHGKKLSVRQAALVNGTSSHALDYDDCNLTMPGHVSAAVLPAVLAMAEFKQASGKDLMTAFAAGFESGCSVGAVIAPGHYDRGFHATGTNGTFGAAAGTAWLLGLSAERSAHALSIAATTASGLKGLFGTMCKPFHAGRAAENGVLAAELAASGFVARDDGIECRQGYAQTHAPSFSPECVMRKPASGWFLTDNLFKFHAACYGTHGVIECALALRGVLKSQTSHIQKVTIQAALENDKTCNISNPGTSAQARFSMRHTMAMALTGYDTSSADAYGGKSLADQEITRLGSVTTVAFIPDVNIAHSFITVMLEDGTEQRVEFDAGQPSTNLGQQRAKLEQKFDALVIPVLGQHRCQELRDMIAQLETLPNVGQLLALCQVA